MAEVHVDEGMAFRLLPPVAEGLTNAEVAKRVGLAEITVKGYLGALYPWLGARNRAHAVHIGHLRGYLEADRAIVVTDEAMHALASAICRELDKHMPYELEPYMTAEMAERFLAVVTPHLAIIPTYRLP